MDSNERERIFDKAAEVGRLLSQTPEYAYLKAAHKDISDDREATETMNRMREIQEQLLAHLDQGEEPPVEMRDELTKISEGMQRSARYQSLIASQTNFDKLMEGVQVAIGKGIRAGEQSRIILPS
jgi:cell fate (sporulation/competence/biofilm development) regulator YlbF (YheA/YmcA/DUF963 family)